MFLRFRVLPPENFLKTIHQKSKEKNEKKFFNFRRKQEMKFRLMQMAKLFLPLLLIVGGIIAVVNIFKNKINELGTEMTLFLTGVLGPFIDAISGALDTGKLLKLLKQQEGSNFSAVNREIVLQANKRASAQFKTNKAMGVYGKIDSFDETGIFNRLKTENIDILLRERLGLKPVDFSNVGMNKGTKPPGSDLATQTFQDREIEPLKQALQIEQNRLNISGEKLTFMKEQF